MANFVLRGFRKTLAKEHTKGEVITFYNDYLYYKETDDLKCQWVSNVKDASIFSSLDYALNVRNIFYNYIEDMVDLIDVCKIDDSGNVMHITGRVKPILPTQVNLKEIKSNE